jgi:hypothetical protein
LGYEFGKGRWKYAVNGGVILNLSSWYSGTTLDTAYQLVQLSSKGAGTVYQQHAAGLSLYGSFSMTHELNDRMDFFAEPYFRYNVSHVNTSNLGFYQRFSAVGLSVGIRYKLNTSKQRN